MLRLLCVALCCLTATAAFAQQMIVEDFEDDILAEELELEGDTGEFVMYVDPATGLPNRGWRPMGARLTVRSLPWGTPFDVSLHMGHPQQGEQFARASFVHSTAVPVFLHCRWLTHETLEVGYYDCISRPEPLESECGWPDSCILPPVFLPVGWTRLAKFSRYDTLTISGIGTEIIFDDLVIYGVPVQTSIESWGAIKSLYE